MKVTGSVGVPSTTKKRGIQGKIVKKRQKDASFASSLKASALRSFTSSADVNSSSDKPTKPSDAHNVFFGLSIKLGDLKRNLTTNCVPVTKDAVPKHFPKKDKRKLRHDTFLKKLQAVHKSRQDKRKKKKRMKKSGDVDMEEASAPALQSRESKPSDIPLPEKRKNVPKSSSKRPIPKAKDRRDQELQDMQLFKEVLSNSVYRANPGAAITSYVRHKACETLV